MNRIRHSRHDTGIIIMETFNFLFKYYKTNPTIYVVCTGMPTYSK